MRDDVAHRREVDKLRQRRWRKRHPTKNRIRNLRYKTRKRCLPNTLTNRQWQGCLEYWGYRCAVCGRKAENGLKLSTDHWIPLAHFLCPGTVVHNIVPLCIGPGGCNNSKNSHVPSLWLLKKYDILTALNIMLKVEAYFNYVRCKYVNDPISSSSDRNV